MGRIFKEVENEISEVPYNVTKNSKGAVIVKANDKEYTPPEISAMVLQKLKQDAEEYLGNKVQMQLLLYQHILMILNDNNKGCWKMSLNVRRIINEPTAALAYGLDKKKMKNLQFLIWVEARDIYLELGDGVFEVKASNGDGHLGGDDFDQKVIN